VIARSIIEANKLVVSATLPLVARKDLSNYGKSTVSIIPEMNLFKAFAIYIFVKKFNLNKKN